MVLCVLLLCNHVHQTRTSDINEEMFVIDIWTLQYVSCVCVCVCTCMGKHGVSLLQVRVQSAPVLNEAVLGLWGVSDRSWSIHCPHSTSKWDRDKSKEIFSFWVYNTSCDTTRAYTDTITTKQFSGSKITCRLFINNESLNNVYESNTRCLFFVHSKAVHLI